jgi:hypothetical protein
MRAWEITGWVLLGLGLFVFVVCFVMLVGLGDQPRILEPAVLMVIGIFIFRGGIQLLKIAAAATVCRSMSDRLLQPAPGDTRASGRKTGFERTV